MNRYRSVLVAMIAIIMPGAAMAQDHNYVPGWADTHNHRYKGNSDSEWAAKTELFKKLGSADPEARCTLKNLSEPDGNVIVNRYRSLSRKTGESAALRWAQGQVALHHRQMRALESAEHARQLIGSYPPLLAVSLRVSFRPQPEPTPHRCSKLALRT